MVAPTQKGRRTNADQGCRSDGVLPEAGEMSTQDAGVAGNESRPGTRVSCEDGGGWAHEEAPLLIGVGPFFVPGVGEVSVAVELCRASAARPFSYPIGVIGLAVGTSIVRQKLIQQGADP